MVNRGYIAAFLSVQFVLGLVEYRFKGHYWEACMSWKTDLVLGICSVSLLFATTHWITEHSTNEMSADHLVYQQTLASMLSSNAHEQQSAVLQPKLRIALNKSKYLPQ